MYNYSYANFLQYIFELDHGKTTKILPSSRSLKAEDTPGTTSAAIFLLVGTDISFVVTNQNIFQDGDFLYGALQIKVLVYTQYGQNVCSFIPPYMSRPQYLDQNNQ